MSILSAVRELGKEIQKDERYVAFAKAKLALDNDTVVQDKINEFNLVRMNLEQAMSAETQDEAKTKELNEKLRNIYAEVMQSKSMADFNVAKADLDTMLGDINSVIGQCVDGADPETVEPEVQGCTGSCSTCGGCH